MSSTNTEKLNRFYDQFTGSDHVLIIINADPDSIASAMAVKRILWRRVTNEPYPISIPSHGRITWQ